MMTRGSERQELRKWSEKEHRGWRGETERGEERRVVVEEHKERTGRARETKKGGTGGEWRW